MTPRRFTDKILVIATHNKGKFSEISALLAPYNIETVSAGELGVPEPCETETSFSGNARLKARFSADYTKLPALADDSGLCVPFLNGDPGVHSARWAGADKNFARAMALVEERLQAKLEQSAERLGGPQSETPNKAERSSAVRSETPDKEQPDSARRAYFTCALALAWPDGDMIDVQGHIDGTLIWPPRGMLGFGYDPIFIPLGYDKTFAEMALPLKQKISHRTRAFDRLFHEAF